MRTHKTKVLVVEDEELAAADVRDYLEDHGYIVCGPVGSGEEALELIESETPDLVLIDIQIKGKLDGADVGYALREKYKIPFIYVTGHTESQILERVKLSEPNGYIVKPFNEKELRVAIELALHNEHSKRALEEWGQRLTSVLASIGEAVIATDAYQRIVFMNEPAELLTGWSAEDAMGLELKDVLRVTLQNEGQAPFDGGDEFYPNYLALARVRNALLQVRHASRVPIDYTVTPIVSDTEGCSGVVVIARQTVDQAKEYDKLPPVLFGGE